MVMLVVVDSLRLATLVHRDIVAWHRRKDVHYTFNPAMTTPLRWAIRPAALQDVRDCLAPRYHLAPWEHSRVLPGVVRTLNLTPSSSPRTCWQEALAVTTTDGSAFLAQTVLSNMLKQSRLTAPLKGWCRIVDASVAAIRRGIEPPRRVQPGPVLVRSQREAALAYTFATLAQTYLEPSLGQKLPFAWSWFWVPILDLLEEGSVDEQDVLATCRPWVGSDDHIWRCHWLGYVVDPATMVGQLLDAGLVRRRDGQLSLSQSGRFLLSEIPSASRDTEWPALIKTWRSTGDTEKLVSTVHAWFDPFESKEIRRWG